VWRDVDRQIGNYVRGKFWEIIIVWLVSYLTFLILGLQYAMVLSVCLGISVLVPFVGVAVITIPVVLVAWFQWGWSADFAYLVGAYIVIKELDANLLVPLLFSEVNNLHPVAIIVAVDRILDMCRTSLNVTSDLIVTKIVDQYEKKRVAS